MKLSKAHIQTIKVYDLMKRKSDYLIRVPYWVPFYYDMVEAYQLVGRLAGGVLE
jgi:hypothetical protein